MGRLLVTLAVGLLVAFAPATRGQAFLPSYATTSPSGTVVQGPDVPSVTPFPAAGDPAGFPAGVVSPGQRVATVGYGPSGDPIPFDQRGLAELTSGDVDLAIADFDEALRLDPTNAVFYYHRALADFRAEKTATFSNFDRALGDLFDAILRDPTKPDYYLARARVFTRMNRFDRARDDYNTVLRSEPSNADARTERDQLKVREVAYNAKVAQDAAQAQAAEAAAQPAPAQPSALQKALEQATIAEVLARQEKANLDAATYRYQRATLAKPAGKTSATPPPDTTKQSGSGGTTTTTPGGTTNITINTGPTTPAPAASAAPAK
jgi:hypothetical protein